MYHLTIHPVFCLTALLVLTALAGGCVARVQPPLDMESLRLRRLDQLEAVEWEHIAILELGTAQHIALRRNPDFIATLSAVNAARMAYYQSLSAYLPSIGFQYDLAQSRTDNTHRHNPPDTIAPEDNSWNSAATLQGSYLLFDGLARELNALAARSSWRESIAGRKNAARLLLRAVAYAYYDVLLSRAELRIAESDLEFQQSNLKQAEVRYRSGNIAKSDFLNFKVLRNRALCTLALRREQCDLTRFALANLLGYPDGTIPKQVDFPEIATEDSSLNAPLGDYLEQALARRPDLAALSEALLRQDYMTQSKISAFLPNVYLNGALGRGSSDSDYHRYSVDSRSWNSQFISWGVTVNWELFEGFKRYNAYREAEFLRTQAQLRLDGAALNAINEVRNAYINYSTQSELVLYYHEMMEWVFEQRHLIEVEYWAGQVTITRLNEAQSELVNAQNNYAAALIELHKGAAQLEAAVNGNADDLDIVPLRTPSAVPGLESLFLALERQYRYAGESVPQVVVQPQTVEAPGAVEAGSAP